MSNAVLDNLERIAEELSKKTAKAGWFSSAVYPENGQQAAYIATIHEFGDTAHNIPPRPFIRPTIATKKAEWASIVTGLFRQGIATNTLPDVLEVIGLTMEGDIRQAIADVVSPPLQPSTLKARKRRGNNNDKPLNDTGYMIASLTSVVSERE